MRIALAQRELGHLAAQRHTYALRMLAPLFAFVGLLIGLGGGDFINQLVPFANSGGVGIGASYTINYLFQLGKNYLFVIVLAAAPLTAAVLLAEEKQSDTLRLLLVTTFRPRDIILTKFAVATTQSLILVFAVFPIWGLAVFFGGVSFDHIAIAALLFAVTCVAASAIGVFLGAALHRTLDAMLGAALLLGGWTAFAHIVDIQFWGWLPFPISIVSALDAVSFPGYTVMDWAPPAIIALLATPVFLAAATRALPRSVVREHAAQARKRTRMTWLPWNRPMAVVASSLSVGMGERLKSPVYLVAVALLLAALATVPIFGWILVLGMLLYDVTAPIAKAHQSTAWHDLMTTPMSDTRLTLAIFMGQLRRTLIFLPAVFVAGTPAILLAQVVYGISGGNIFQDVILFVREFNGGLIFGIYILIHLTQGMFIVALGTYLGTLGRNAFWQTFQAIVLVAAVYAFFTLLGRELALESSRNARSTVPAGVDYRPVEYRQYAIVLAITYLIPYTIGLAAVGYHLSTRLRVLMGLAAGEPSRAWTLLTKPIRLPRFQGAARP